MIPLIICSIVAVISFFYGASCGQENSKQLMKVPRNLNDLMEVNDNSHFYPDPNFIIDLNLNLLEFLSDLKLKPYTYSFYKDKTSPWNQYIWINHNNNISIVIEDPFSDRMFNARFVDNNISINQITGLEDNLIKHQFNAWYNIIQQYELELKAIPIGLKVVNDNFIVTSNFKYKSKSK